MPFPYVDYDAELQRDDETLDEFFARAPNGYPRGTLGHTLVSTSRSITAVSRAIAMAFLPGYRAIVARSIRDEEERAYRLAIGFDGAVGSGSPVVYEVDGLRIVRQVDPLPVAQALTFNTERFDTDSMHSTSPLPLPPLPLPPLPWLSIDSMPFDATPNACWRCDVASRPVDELGLCTPCRKDLTA